MSRRSPLCPPRRDGFSLIEMILATAILAASGSALFMLIGQASQFGLRAEEQATALQLAQSLLDETIAMPAAVETEGTFENDPRWSYRIVRESAEDGASVENGASVGNGAPIGNGSTLGIGAIVGDEQPRGKLTRIVVEVDRSDDAPRPVAPSGSAGSAGSTDGPVCRLVRWVYLVGPVAEGRPGSTSAAAP